ncbi:hypothetical protein NDN08_000217 [Rhodosorus marinus]|uniref:E2 ubiquitin-conjugating enzyme n=1 Tax=Rhodosorus marinus TaxID=101924 RepID=A0AAV8UEM0_9RHOD|nr:hypothetical protein NDN08_000217 [Rhodosorus marinus]
MGLSGHMMTKLARELRSLQDEPVDGVRVLVNEGNLSVVKAEIDGPVGTPFEGGVFKMRLEFTHEFPSAPPKGFFQTKIFHPNVSEKGEICVNTLKKDWKADYGLRHIFLVIRCLLIDPNPESALNEEAGKLLLEFYDEYAKMAKLWTEIHARRRGTENSDGNISKFNSQTSAESELTTKLSGGSVDSQSGKKEASKRRMKRL